ncbi:MAG: DNA helicase RecQ [Ignavibacteriae bacterium]|nr:DNA helicase RecQ [Ignavibacteriota bacterium]
MLDKASSILQKIFGYDNFRPLQKDIIESIISKKDSLVIMPTGGGKSLCYQIPALVFDGLTVVISPLISLMKDQVEQLKELGIDAVFLNSSLSPDEYQTNVNLLLQKKIKLLYLAPETLAVERTVSILNELQIDFITVDEAHCISEWGHDFRPTYREISKLKSSFPNAVCAAFTATATPRVEEDILRSLSLKKAKVFKASFNRDNLYLEVTAKTDGLSQVKSFLRKYPNQAGIIYCFSRKQVDSLAHQLNGLGFSALPYHAGLPDDVRVKNQEKFINDDVQIMVATVAFGMGINKSNVRFVIHYNLPKNVESYYQEIGRAGRDGLRSHCLLLFDYSDTYKIQFFIDQKIGNEKRIAEEHLDVMLNYADFSMCRRIPLLNYFGEKYNKHNCGMCDNCKSFDKDLVDITIPAQKFLSCVKRTNETFGAHHIIDILRGSKNQKVLEFNHDKLSTYNIGTEFTKKQWINLAFQFQQKKLLEIDQEYKSLKLTEKAYSVLRKKEQVLGRIIDDAEPSKTVEFTENYDHVLFAALRMKRKEIADQLKLPPYVIFSDKTITEMATYFPVNKREMLAIHGLGEIKFEKYGQIFINEIIEYCLKHNIKPNGREIDKSALKETQSYQKNYNDSADKFNSGLSIKEIAVETKYKKSTILKQLFDYVQSNKLENPNRLLDDSSLSNSQINSIIEHFNSNGISETKSLEKIIKKKISEDELLLLKIYYKSVK